jgi:hypothetical protein
MTRAFVTGAPANPPGPACIDLAQAAGMHTCGSVRRSERGAPFATTTAGSYKNIRNTTSV